MARKLKQNVFVSGVFYPAGSSPEKDVAEQITNPNAWGGKADAPEADEAPEAEQTDDESTDAPEADEAPAPSRKPATRSK